MSKLAKRARSKRKAPATKARAANKQATAGGAAPGAQLSRAEAISLFRSGLGAALQATAAQYAMPLCYIAAQDGAPVVLASGTAFLIDCGQGPFLVTARHVLQGFRDALKQHKDAVCVVCEIPRFDLLERVIAEDPAYDVATFRVTPEDLHQLKASGKIPLTGSQRSWPPSPPQVERGMFFIGFPGDGRTLRPYRGGGLVEVDWIGYTAVAIADSVSCTGISLLLQHDPVYDIGLRPAAPPEWALGGCSGAPLLTLVEHKGVFSWRLGGVIYEAGEMIVKASRADCLNPDGTINAHPNPMAYRRPASLD
jgi:hypothetical protein